LVKTFPIAASCAQVHGFAVGRAIFGEAARCWFSGHMTDEAAVAEMASRFTYLVDAWRAANRGITG
jgi:5-dehydro-2-deoxygluconokinase